MISVRKAHFFKKREYSKELKSNGFISATELSKMSNIQSDRLEIDSKRIDNSKILKQTFESDNCLRCVCLDYGGACKKYWYYIDDLRKLYPLL